LEREGRALSVFFGPTPESTAGKIIPASGLNSIGRVLGDATRLKEVIKEKEVLLEIP